MAEWLIFYLPFLASDGTKDGLYEILDEVATALHLGVALLNSISRNVDVRSTKVASEVAQQGYCT
jgi:hypothetical protein